MSKEKIKLLVISDSHGRADRVRELCNENRDADAVIFLGDGVKDICLAELSPRQALCAVRGNCDWLSVYSPLRDEFPEERFLVFGNYHILIMHGHTGGVKSGYENALLYAYKRGADVLLFGHTHMPLEKYIQGGTEINGTVLERPMYIFNPGALGAGSFGRIEIRGNNILFSHGDI